MILGWFYFDDYCFIPITLSINNGHLEMKYGTKDIPYQIMWIKIGEEICVLKKENKSLNKKSVENKKYVFREKYEKEKNVFRVLFPYSNV